MPHTLDENDWELLLSRIKDEKCTPFIGAGACFGSLPLGYEIANILAEEYGYPLADYHNLARVAQFIALKFDDSMFPKEKILRRFFKKIEYPKFEEPDEPHGVLADLPLPIYITTNYDDFMVEALKRRKKDPHREMCLWNKELEGQPNIFQ